MVWFAGLPLCSCWKGISGPKVEKREERGALGRLFWRPIIINQTGIKINSTLPPSILGFLRVADSVLCHFRNAEAPCLTYTPSFWTVASYWKQLLQLNTTIPKPAVLYMRCQIHQKKPCSHGLLFWQPLRSYSLLHSLRSVLSRLFLQTSDNSIQYRRW